MSNEPVPFTGVEYQNLSYDNDDDNTSTSLFIISNVDVTTYYCIALASVPHNGI